MEPVTRARKVNNAPIFADEIKIISKILIRQMREIIEEKKSTEYANNDNQALGTWTYIILNASPC
tara:strand:+ start:92 stop:286 length:195 start_codon:yes stop_codon:yes gene_type:complete